MRARVLSASRARPLVLFALVSVSSSFGASLHLAVYQLYRNGRGFPRTVLQQCSHPVFFATMVSSSMAHGLLSAEKL